MKKSTLAAIGIATLAIGACQNNQDQVTNADLNTDLNALAENAAIEANEMDTLGNQQEQLNSEAENAVAPTDNLANPADADTAVNGM